MSDDEIKKKSFNSHFIAHSHIHAANFTSVHICVHTISNGQYGSGNFFPVKLMKQFLVKLADVTHSKNKITMLSSQIK